VTRRILIGAGLVLVVILVGWFEGFYHPEAHHIATLQAQEQVASDKVVQLDAQYADLLHSERQLPAERAALAALSEAVPNGPELDNLVKSIFAAAGASGVQLTTISSPQPVNFGVAAPASTSGPAEVMLTIGVSGTPSQVEALVNKLDSEHRLFVVDTFSLQDPTAISPTKASKGGGSGTGTGSSIVLRAFYASASSDNPAS
jgi:Tfp pilus assembly protein PilO